MFAEGKFYLATQQSKDFVSPGPWVDGVQVRVGVDTDNDTQIDQWTDWAKVSESYDYIEGFPSRFPEHLLGWICPSFQPVLDFNTKSN